MYEVLKKILFLFGAQRVHKALEFCAPSLSYCPFLMNFVAKRCIFSDAILEQKIFEQDFLNPVGIAGGFDKSAKMLRLLTYIGDDKGGLYLFDNDVKQLVGQGGETPVV